MKIISIPIYGALEHKDYRDNKAVIKENEVQTKSTESNTYHSEYNYNKTLDTNYFQIWFFPRKKY